MLLIFLINPIKVKLLHKIKDHYNVLKQNKNNYLKGPFKILWKPPLPYIATPWVRSQEILITVALSLKLNDLTVLLTTGNVYRRFTFEKNMCVNYN